MFSDRWISTHLFKVLQRFIGLFMPSFPTYDIQTVSIDNESGLTDKRSIVREFPAGSAKNLLHSLQAP